ncbi:MAG: zinc ribbon domain-containing protein [Ruminococcaceae bacterium]|jgi:hypothetical protein|nr:zinc ribbon domain-containing protein [Oscillospiraceae bacterium]
MANHCVLCGEKIGKHETVCGLCASICDGGQTILPETLRQFWNLNNFRLAAFTETNELKSFFSSQIIHIDNNHHMFYAAFKRETNPLVFLFNEVVSYEYVKTPGTIVTKKKGGLGGAVVGGTMFGVAGAVVGASTARSETTEVGGSQSLIVHLRTPYWVKTLSLTPPKGFTDFLNQCINYSTFRPQRPVQPHPTVANHYCPNCGTAVSDSNFCPNCGYDMRAIAVDIMQKATH